MTTPYRKQLLDLLSDGQWHAAHELAHPTFPFEGLAAFIRILRASGYDIVEEGQADERRYRLLRG